MLVDKGRCGYLLHRSRRGQRRREEPLAGRWAVRGEDEDDEGDAQTSGRCLTGGFHLRLNTHLLDISWYFFLYSKEQRRKVLLLVLRSRAGCENGAAWINSAQGRSGLIWALFCDCETSPFGLNEIPLYLSPFSASSFSGQQGRFLLKTAGRNAGIDDFTICTLIHRRCRYLEKSFGSWNRSKKKLCQPAKRDSNKSRERPSVTCTGKTNHFWIFLRNKRVK